MEHGNRSKKIIKSADKAKQAPRDFLSRLLYLHRACPLVLLQIYIVRDAGCRSDCITKCFDPEPERVVFCVFQEIAVYPVLRKPAHVRLVAFGFFL